MAMDMNFYSHRERMVASAIADTINRVASAQAYTADGHTSLGKRKEGEDEGRVYIQDAVMEEIIETLRKMQVLP
mgnify:CR=1 FL=1